MENHRARREKLSFQNNHGQTLAALLELPDGEPRGYALFAHCFTCSKNIGAASMVSQAIAKLGIAVLRFDFTGLGSSDGDFANTNFSSNVEDLVCAADFLRREYEAPSLLLGHSLGGAAVLAAAGQIPELKGVATMGAPSDPSHVQHLFAENLEKIQQEGKAKVMLAGREFEIQKQFVDDISSQNLAAKIAAIEPALLVIHAPGDDTVEITNAEEIFSRATYPKAFCSIDGADHLLTRKEDAEYTGQVLAAWASKFLQRTGASSTKDAPKDEDGVVWVIEKNKKFAQNVYASGHVVFADEPPSVGGDNTGPTPYDLMLAALGTCTSMTLRMYANHKKWDLEKIEVRLEHQRVHSDDCAHCEESGGKIDQLTREIFVSGKLDQKQKQRLLEIADKCPVHKSMMNEKEIVTRLSAKDESSARA